MKALLNGTLTGERRGVSPTCKKLSKTEALLGVCAQLAIRTPVIPLHVLIVAAWKRYPDMFGLKGYEDTFPCSNRVIVWLCVLVRSGRVRRAGANLLEMGRP